MNTTDVPLQTDTAFWHALFAADSVAVIGAKDVPGTWGYDAIKAVVDSRKVSPDRRVYPVNPGQQEVLGLPAVASVLDIPDAVELAVIVVPAKVVPAVFRECGQKGVKAAVIISAGFAEVDEAGAALQADIAAASREYGLRFVGPNCIGHADFHTRIASAGMAAMMPRGRVALLSQSGTLTGSIMQSISGHGMGFSKMVSTGNEADLHLEDFIAYLGTDEKTDVIAAYIEGFREGRRFFNITRELTRRKPVVVIKSGGTGAAAKAARSHTGALAGSDAVADAAFRQAGVIRADDEDELCDIIQGLLYQPLPRGDRVAILTMGGGFGVITAEACEREGIKIAGLAEETLHKIDGVLPDRWNRGNPVDLVGMRPAAGDDTNAKCLHYLLQDPGVDAVISLLPPSLIGQVRIEDLSPEKLKEKLEENRKTADKVAGELKQYGKPVYGISRFGLRLPDVKTEYIPVNRIPDYSNQRRAARVIGKLVRYAHYLDTRKK